MTTRPTKKLGEIGVFIRGITYHKEDLLSSHENGCVTLLRSNNIQDELNLKELQYLPKRLITEEKILQKGDILFCMSNGSKDLVGKNILLPDLEDYSFGAFCSIFRPNKPEESLYIHHFLRSTLYKEYIYGLSRGIGINNLRNGDLEVLEIPLPPIDIQKAIVTKLDEAFAEIDETISLTEENIAKTEEFPTSFSKGIFEKLEKEYEVHPLLKYVEFIGGSQPEKKFFSYSPKDGYVRLIQIRDYKSENNLTYIDAKSTKKFCNRDDIMIGRYGPPVFQILRGLEGAYNVALMKAIPNEKMISKDYLFRFLQNPNIQNYIINISQRSAGQSGVNKEALEKYNIAIPPLEKQAEIVSYLDQVFAETSALKSDYENKLTHLKELKASILQSAFEGKLI